MSDVWTSLTYRIVKPPPFQKLCCNSTNFKKSKPQRAHYSTCIIIPPSGLLPSPLYCTTLNFVKAERSPLTEFVSVQIRRLVQQQLKVLTNRRFLLPVLFTVCVRSGAARSSLKMRRAMERSKAETLARPLAGCLVPAD